MKKILLVLLLSFYAPTAWALTIATGPSDGSYFQIAQDIKNVAAKDGIDLQVLPSKGSLENLELLGSGKVDLAIVQLDALRFVSDVMKQDLGLNLFEKIKVVMNLYPEEIHILTNKKDIQTFYNLEGKRVSVGPPLRYYLTFMTSKRPSPRSLLKRRLRKWSRATWIRCSLSAALRCLS